MRGNKAALCRLDFVYSNFCMLEMDLSGIKSWLFYFTFEQFISAHEEMSQFFTNYKYRERVSLKYKNSKIKTVQIIHLSQTKWKTNFGLNIHIIFMLRRSF
jgi:hypothetical protein